VAVVREVTLAAVHVVDVIAVMFRIMAALWSVLVVAVIRGLGMANDVIDDAFVPVVLIGDVLERLRFLPHLRRDLRHRVLLPTIDAPRVPRWR
jgi:hypothetical protein